ncbi:MAG: sugar translocase [Deltaproteobacteria bacterium]|nr:sugar translocase [Deltaproteobacteria bacterium]
MSKTFSFVGALLFSFLPFHFFRFGHLPYTWYFVAPLFAWYSFKIFQSPTLFLTPNSTLRSISLHAIVLLLLSSFGVYYAFFGILMLFSAGAAASIQQHSWKNFLVGLLSIIIVITGVGVNLAPNMIYHLKHGANPEVAQRTPGESEIYGLKIIQLLLPRPGHRSAELATISNDYINTAPLINENFVSCLGLIGSIGFLVLLGAPLVNAGRFQVDHRLYRLSILTIVLLLFCTVGGFSALFAFFVTPQIRSWNRVSVFIGFTSIAAFAILADILLKRISNQSRSMLLAFVVGTCVVAFGIWDQTASTDANHLWKDEYISDRMFAHEIERSVPTGTAVYQLPYMIFPEGYTIHDMTGHGYGLARCYLYSSHLKWSFGCMKGREGDLFFKTLAQQPLSRQVEIIKRLGFGGIYIDRRAYQDHGAALEAELSKLLGGSRFIVSTDGQLSFCRVEPTATLPANLTHNQIMEFADFYVDHLGIRYNATLQDGMDFRREGFPLFLADVQGLSGREPWGRWSDGNLSSTVKFFFKKPLPRRFTLILRVLPFYSAVCQAVEVRIGDQVNLFSPGIGTGEFAMVFNLNHDADVIEITPPNPKSPADLELSPDVRKVSLGFEKLAIIKAEN